MSQLLLFFSCRLGVSGSEQQILEPTNPDLPPQNSRQGVALPPIGSLSTKRPLEPLNRNGLPRLRLQKCAGSSVLAIQRPDRLRSRKQRLSVHGEQSEKSG